MDKVFILKEANRENNKLSNKVNKRLRIKRRRKLKRIRKRKIECEIILYTLNLINYELSLIDF